MLSNVASYPMTRDKRLIIYRLRLCPACGKHKAVVAKTDKEKKPVLKCRKCGKSFGCEYFDD